MGGVEWSGVQANEKRPRGASKEKSVMVITITVGMDAPARSQPVVLGTLVQCGKVIAGWPSLPYPPSAIVGPALCASSARQTRHRQRRLSCAHSALSPRAGQTGGRRGSTGRRAGWMLHCPPSSTGGVRSASIVFVDCNRVRVQLFPRNSLVRDWTGWIGIAQHATSDSYIRYTWSVVVQHARG